MDKLLIPISNEEFNSLVNIRFKNILDGFNLFKNFTIEADNIKEGENKLIKFIEKIFEENNNEGYVDFYINKLSPEDTEKLISLICEKDVEIFKLHLNLEPTNSVYYKLTDKALIPFLVRLNTRELFFITFYFSNKPITIWGNYNMKFPCFFNNQEDFNFYCSLSKSFGFKSVQ
jgi:hypothetical protein